MTTRLLTSMAGRGRPGAAARVLLSLFVTCAALRSTAGGAEESECGATWRERSLDGGERVASHVDLGLDIANNAYVARAVGGRIEVEILGSGFETHLVVPPGSGAQSDPVVATTSAGVTYVAYSESRSESPESGRDVFLAKAVGGTLGTQRRLSSGQLDDHGARIDIDSGGRPHLVWTQRDGEAARVVYWNDDLEAPRVVADPGEAPSLSLYADGRVCIAYVREGDVACVRGTAGEFEAEVPVTTSPEIPERAVSTLVDAAGAVIVVYESEGRLVLARQPDGAGFDPPLTLEEGGAHDPDATLTPRGDLLIVYVKRDDVFHLLGAPGSLGDPIRITNTDEVEKRPAAALDTNGALHLAFVRQGEVHYATNACAPEVDFSAEPRTGRVPLGVRFTDLSGESVTRWEWDFGDGGVSTRRDPEHVYQEPGAYTVRLTVWAPGGVTGTKVVGDFISVEDPINSLEIPDQQVIPGAREVWFPVMATHVEPIQGFQLMGTYDPRFLEIVRSDTVFTTLEAHRISPEFFETKIFDTRFEIGCLFDILPPFEGTVLPPSRHLRLLNLIVDIPSSAPQGETTTVRLLNDRAISPIFNILIVDGFNRLPALKASTVKIRRIEPPFPRVFVRGDVDANGAVNVSDAIALLAYLFQGGEAPPCLDAADVTDTGQINLGSAAAILSFLFSGGQPPAPPYPNPGLDPTDDALGECRS